MLNLPFRKPLNICGHTCRLGWGFDEGTGRYVVVDKNPVNLKCVEYSCSRIVDHSFCCNDYLPRLELNDFFLPFSEKFFDFCIFFDEERYSHVHWVIVYRTEECDQHPDYPANATYFVRRIEYGTELRINVLESNVKKLKKVLNSEDLDGIDDSKEIKILINHNETLEMSLLELSNFIVDLKEEKYPEFICPIQAHLRRIPNISKIAIKNEVKIKRLLIYLYNVFRRIEIKMEESGSPIISILERKGLYETKKNYKMFINTNDFLTIHQTTKELYYCYLDCLESFFQHRINVIEEDSFLENCDELKNAVKRLNNWIPSKEEIESFNPKVFLIWPKHSNLQKKLKETKKFKTVITVHDENFTEPLISIFKTEKLCFGFIDMKDSIVEDSPCKYPVFQYRCPLNCPNERKWICTTCGDFVTVKFVNHPMVNCSCGSKAFRENLLSCPNHIHNLESEQVSDPVANIQNLELGNLNRIKVQFEKLSRNYQENDPFTEVIRKIIDRTTPVLEIKNTLRKINVTRLNGDTAHLIEEYLNED